MEEEKVNKLSERGEEKERGIEEGLRRGAAAVVWM